MLLLGAAAVLYLAMLGGRDIVNGVDARIPQTARVMAQSWPWQSRTIAVPRVELTDIGNGTLRLYPRKDRSSYDVNPWLVPVLSGQVRLQKPPLPYWSTAIALDS